jgi:hypothetical protein
MSLIKKIDVEKHFAERRAMRLGTIRTLGLPGAARIKPAASRKKAPAFIEDFALEHSSPSVSTASIPLTSDSGRSRLLRAPGIRQV